MSTVKPGFKEVFGGKHPGSSAALTTRASATDAVKMNANCIVAFHFFFFG